MYLMDSDLFEEIQEGNAKEALLKLDIRDVKTGTSLITPTSKVVSHKSIERF